MRIPPYFDCTPFRGFLSALLEDGLWEHKILRYLSLAISGNRWGWIRNGRSILTRWANDSPCCGAYSSPPLLPDDSITPNHESNCSIFHFLNLSDVEEKAEFLLRMGRWLCWKYDLRFRSPCILMLVICWQGHTKFQQNKLKLAGARDISHSINMGSSHVSLSPARTGDALARG